MEGLFLLACTQSTKVHFSNRFLKIKADCSPAISADNFIEIIRFFTTLILNVDESSLP